MLCAGTGLAAIADQAAQVDKVLLDGGALFESGAAVGGGHGEVVPLTRPILPSQRPPQRRPAGAAANPSRTRDRTAVSGHASNNSRKNAIDLCDSYLKGRVTNR
jgi:hypothetical protein